MRYLLPNWPQMPQLLEEESMVNLAHLFSQHDQEFELLFLTPDPWLRRTLKENWLLPENWWSVFDAIQGVTIQTGQPVDIEDLGLPKDAERVFSQSQITINRQDRLYASINAFPSGFILSVVLPNGQQGKEKRFYDDRGFLSYSQMRGADDQVIQCQWFDMTGAVVMTQDQSGAVTIADTQTERFLRQHYDNLDQVIFEKLAEHLEPDADPELITMAGMDQPLLRRLMVDYPVTMLVEEHLSQKERQSVISNAAQAVHVVSPTDHFAKQLQTAIPAKATTEIQVIPPYATKLALGVSNETDQTIIMWNVNGLNDDRLAVVYQQLLEALVKEERRRLLVIADSDDQAAQLQRQAGQFLAEQEGVGTDSGVFTQIQEAVKQWEDVSANSKVKIENAQMPAPKTQQDEPSDESVHRQQIAFQIFRMLTHIHFVVNPKVGQLKQWLANSRLLVDLGDQPNLLLQIGAISAAIPQINRHPTGYVQNQVNGRIIDEDRELKTALKAYLEILSKWNRTVVANVKMIDQHDDDQLMRLWKKVLTRG